MRTEFGRVITFCKLAWSIWECAAPIAGLKWAAGATTASWVTASITDKKRPVTQTTLIIKLINRIGIRASLGHCSIHIVAAVDTVKGRIIIKGNAIIVVLTCIPGARSNRDRSQAPFVRRDFVPQHATRQASMERSRRSGKREETKDDSSKHDSVRQTTINKTKGEFKGNRRNDGRRSWRFDRRNIASLTFRTIAMQKVDCGRL